MRFADFWAGGMPQSGEWYVSTGADQETSAVAANPTGLHTGRCCPNPLKKNIDPMFVVTIRAIATLASSMDGLNLRPSAEHCKGGRAAR